MVGKKQQERILKATNKIANVGGKKKRPVKTQEQQNAREAASTRFAAIQKEAHKYYKKGQANTMTWRDAIRKGAQDYNSKK